MAAGAARALRLRRVRPVWIGLLLLVQVVCTLVFVFDILAVLLRIEMAPLAWRIHELIEIGAALGLLLGVGMGAWVLRRTLAVERRTRDQLRAASGAFLDVVEERFEEWSLTPAERDVALFAIKGLSTADIAALRQTSEGTVKAQTAAIYRKAGVSGRPQLLSLFIDELMDFGPSPRDAA